MRYFYNTFFSNTFSQLSVLCDYELLDLMKSYFSNRFQYTIVNNDSSNFCKITTGVPQGSIIGPLMYAIYVNDVFNVTDFMKINVFFTLMTLL